ncbi:MAG: hypothetical protein AB1750_02630 [Chloroflexota bacterium]
MNLASRLKSALPAETYSLLRLIADEATRRGLTLYAVGGLPRDLLLRRLTRDLDLVLESDAIPLARALARAHGGRVTAHPAFHTATWFLPPSLSPEAPATPSPDTRHSPPFIDLISARSETYAHPAALPAVKLGNLNDDLRRRDFTVNAMALRLDDDHFGELLDPFNGKADLRKRLVRVLHPRSFVDDPTRIFRAVRYAERYGFRLAPDTEALVPVALKHVNKLSGERLRHELDLILAEDTCSSAVERLRALGVLAAVKPPLVPPKPKAIHWFGVFHPTGLDFSVSPTEMGYFFWLMDVPDETILAFAKRLDFTADQTKALRAASRLKRDLPALQGLRPSQWTERLDKVPPLAIFAVRFVTRRPELKEYLLSWRRRKPTITGEDLIARGLVPGPEFKRILSRLRAAWLDGEVTNKKEEAFLLEALL